MPKQPEEKTLKQVYSLMLKTLSQIPNVQKEIDYYRTVDYRKWTDNDFFETMSEVIFYSNLPRSTVNHKLPAIKEAFSDFDITDVAEYSRKDIEKLKETPEIIHHIDRIEAVKKCPKIEVEKVYDKTYFFRKEQGYDEPKERRITQQILEEAMKAIE